MLEFITQTPGVTTVVSIIVGIALVMLTIFAIGYFYMQRQGDKAIAKTSAEEAAKKPVSGVISTSKEITKADKGKIKDVPMVVLPTYEELKEQLVTSNRELVRVNNLLTEAHSSRSTLRAQAAEANIILNDELRNSRLSMQNALDSVLVATTENKNLSAAIVELSKQKADLDDELTKLKTTPAAPVKTDDKTSKK